MLQEPRGKMQHTSGIHEGNASNWKDTTLKREDLGKEKNCQIMAFEKDTLEEEMEATSKGSHPTRLDGKAVKQKGKSTDVSA